MYNVTCNKPYLWLIAFNLNVDSKEFIARKNTLEQNQTLEKFLAEVERRAFRMAEIATGNSDEALDILQDAMFKLVEKYSERDAAEWGPLFQTILQSKIRDWYRRNTVRNRFRAWFHPGLEQSDEDLIDNAIDEKIRTPEQQLQSSRRLDVLELSIRGLPLRQQQAVMLKLFEDYDVKQTARIMQCSEGSVKTHYSRAIKTLREKLGDHWP